MTPYRVGTYAAGANGQAVQLFGNGAAQTMTAQIRAIKSDATQGSAVGINAGAPGFDQPRVSVNASGRLVAAWTLDTEGTAPIGLAATLGSRSSLPRTATVLQTDGQDVSDVATAVDASGNGVVAWIESPQGAPGPPTVKARRLRPGQAPQVATLDTRREREPRLPLARSRQRRATHRHLGREPRRRDRGADRRRPWRRHRAPSHRRSRSRSGRRRSASLQTFVMGDGGMIAFWVEGTLPSGPLHVKTTQAAPGGELHRRAGADRRPAGTRAGAFRNERERPAAVLFPLSSGGGTTLKVQLRTSSGTWGNPRQLGSSGRYTNGGDVGVDAKGRVVALWDDGSASSKAATRVLAARSSSSSDPLGSYNQVSQRSGDKRCNLPDLFLSTSGDGLGLWQCSTSSSGTSFAPRLARLTKPS